MATTQVRVPGGGNTFMVMGLGKGTRVAFLANVNDQPGQSVGRATAIHPIGYAYPVEIATPYAQDMGTLTLTVWSKWGQEGWVSAFSNQPSLSPWKKYTSHHGGGTGYPVDLREVFEAQRDALSKNGYVTCQKFELGASGQVVRVKKYEGAVITNIDATDNVDVGTMEQRTRITLNYTHITVVTGSKAKGLAAAVNGATRYLDL